MDAEDLFGLQARLADGTRFGRITEVFFDEETGEVSYVVVERGEESFEVLQPGRYKLVRIGHSKCST